MPASNNVPTLAVTVDSLLMDTRVLKSQVPSVVAVSSYKYFSLILKP